MKTALLTHNDLDGIGCAVVFSVVLPGAGPIELVENGKIDGRVRALLEERMAEASDHEVLVTDHAVDPTTADLVESFIAAGGGFTLLDHHRSARTLARWSWATIDESRSATGLLFDHLGRPPALADFAAVVEDHDLWKHNDPRSRSLAALVGLIRHEKFLARFSSDPRVEFTEGELMLLENEDSRREEFLARKVEQARQVEIDGVHWAICYAEQYQSDLAQRLMNELNVAATAIVNAGKRTVSMRGRDVDVSPIAVRFGGGGHARAAAFTFRGRPLEVTLEAFETALDAGLRADYELDGV